MQLKAIHVVIKVYYVQGIIYNFTRLMSAITENIHKHPNICNTQYAFAKM